VRYMTENVAVGQRLVVARVRMRAKPSTAAMTASASPPNKIVASAAVVNPVPDASTSYPLANKKSPMTTAEMKKATAAPTAAHPNFLSTRSPHLLRILNLLREVDDSFDADQHRCHMMQSGFADELKLDA